MTREVKQAVEIILIKLLIKLMKKLGFWKEKELAKYYSERQNYIL